MSTIKTSQLEGISSQLGAINVPLGTVLTVDGMLEFESTGGHKIPAGTGLRKYNDILVGSKQEYDDLIQSSTNDDEVNIN